jgi:hypothetical protein
MSPSAPLLSFLVFPKKKKLVNLLRGMMMIKYKGKGREWI